MSRLGAPLDPNRAWREARVVLLTQHGKEALLGPVLAQGIGCHVERVSGFDTDRLGTFTREIPREGTQLDAARRKARTGMQLADCPMGLASEGAFGPDPYTGFMPWNVEVVVLIDDVHGVEVIGTAAGPANSNEATLRDEAALEDFAIRAGFPDHHLVLRPDGLDGEVRHKGLADWPTLRDAFRETLAASRTGQVVAENDLRAHCNPTRQAVIRQAGENLLARLRSPCPACHAPGFWRTSLVEGLPCAECLKPTREAIAERWTCGPCGHGEERPLPTRSRADPSRCDWCNP